MISNLNSQFPILKKSHKKIKCNFSSIYERTHPNRTILQKQRNKRKAQKFGTYSYSTYIEIYKRIINLIAGLNLGFNIKFVFLKKYIK